MKNLLIRSAILEDIPQVVNIRIKGWQAAYKNIIDSNYLKSLDYDIERRINKMKSNYKDGGFIVAEQNNEIVGFCRYMYDNSYSPSIDVDCEIMALYVRPDLKRQGIGSKMFNHVVEEFKSLNKKEMIIWCLKENYPSIEFYKVMGGNIVGEKDMEIGNILYKEIGFKYNLRK